MSLASGTRQRPPRSGFVLTGNPEVTPPDWSRQAFQFTRRTTVALLGSRKL